MALSSYELSLRVTPAFWPNHTMEPPRSWTRWSDQLKWAIIAEDQLDIDNVNGPEVPENQIPILEQPTVSDLDAESASWHARNKNAMKSFKKERSSEEQKRTRSQDQSYFQPSAMKEKGICSEKP